MKNKSNSNLILLLKKALAAMYIVFAGAMKGFAYSFGKLDVVDEEKNDKRIEEEK
jgi:hypothetical protein